MENPLLKLGMHLKNNKNDEEYRIIYLTLEVAIFCLMNTDRLVLEYRPVLTILKMLTAGVLIEIPEENYVVDINTMGEKNKESFLKNKEILDVVTQLYGPTFMHLSGKKNRPNIEDILSKYSISRPTFWKKVRKFLQSGMNEKSLIDGRNFKDTGGYKYSKKPGRKREFGELGKLLDETDFANFMKYSDLYLGNKSTTIESVFVQLIADCYRERYINADESISYVPKSENERPSYNQFYYYIRNNVTQEKRDKAKMGPMDQRNNKRLLLGNSKTDVFGPGDLVEIDACEVNIALVSREYPEKAVGRPILYLMIDVYTRLIVAVSVAMDNNSIAGLTNCFANLIEDKHLLCARYGIKLDNDAIWPTNYLPSAIRVDRGSEFISKDIHRFAKEFGIRIDTVSGGSGSLKGVVERMFLDIHDKQNEFLEGKGLITKRYDSNHHKEACLNIDEYTAILLNYVLYHNQHYMESYIKTPEMIENAIKPTPEILWEYGCQKLGYPKVITNKDQFLYRLMIPKKASVTRRGICFEGLYYLNLNDEDMMNLMYEQQGKSIKIDIRHDPREMEHIYYLKDGKLQSAILNPAYQEYEGYKGISYQHLKQLQKKAKEMDYAGREINRQNRAVLCDVNKAIINSASKPRYTDVNDIVENRHKEKEKISQGNSFSEKFYLATAQTFEAVKVELIDKQKERNLVVESVLDNKKDLERNKQENIFFQDLLDIMLDDED